MLLELVRQDTDLIFHARASHDSRFMLTDIDVRGSVIALAVQRDGVMRLRLVKEEDNDVYKFKIIKT